MKTAWPLVRLGDALHQRKTFIAIDDKQVYTRPKVKIHAQGIVLRDRVLGSEIKTKKQQVCRADDFLVAEIDAKTGGFGIVPAALNQAIVSSHYFLFEINQEKLLPEFLSHYCTTKGFRNQVAAKGTTNYAAIRARDVLEYVMPLPSLAEQARIVSRFASVQQKLQAVEGLRASIDQDISSLLAVKFQETLKHAKWLPMREVAPLVRREVKIDTESNYSELGVRSFFKGAFIRRTVTGAEFTWQNLYQVNADDLIFSNIMAWEKGIALANSGHDKCVGNHRMLTCEAKPVLAHPKYLHYYFTTEEGFAKVYAASPGTAARNRTLTADALMGLTVPLPTLAVQRQFVELKNALEKSVVQRAEQKPIVDAMLPSLVQSLLVN